MPGPRMTTDALKAKGAKHLSKAEEAQRRAGEVSVAPPKTAKPPKWLPESLKGDFRALGKKLIAAGLYTDLDADTLGRYLVAQRQYTVASRKVQDYLDQEDLGEALGWSKLQEKYFKQCRDCANDMGLTVTSRCRLVLPQNPAEKAGAAENPFLALIQGGKASNG